MFAKRSKAVGCLLLTAALAVGCAKQGQEPTPAAETPKAEPVTLTLFNAQPAGIDFEKAGLIQAVQSKYPHITLNVINKDKDQDYPNLMMAGTQLDIIYEATSLTTVRIIDNGLAYDIDELIKKHKFDLKQFEPNVLAHSYSINSDGKLFGLPFTMNKYALYYNKDIFDKFGVAYPKDGMTWDEIYELAKKVTRVENGVTYYGFTTIPNNMMLNNQLSLNPLHLTEDRANVNTDGWKALYENLARFFLLPNSKLVPNTEAVNGNIAMVLDPGTLANRPNDVKWDVVSVPAMKERPNVGLKPASLSLFVSQTSKHKDEAFLVMAHLVSEEVQMALTRQAIATPLASERVKSMFGQDLPVWQGKNVKALYYYPDAPPAEPRAKGLTDITVNFSNSFNQMLAGKDVNTTLREFEEGINKNLEAEKAKKK